MFPRSKIRRLTLKKFRRRLKLKLSAEKFRASNLLNAEKISAALENLVPAALCIFREGINRAMNKFNTRRAKNDASTLS